MNTQYTVHPAAAVFPMLDGAALQALADDIKANGLRIPIQVIGKEIVDGRNRLAACELAGIEPVFAKVKDAPADLFDYVVSMNIARRHLTTAQRAAIAADLANVKRGGDRTGKDDDGKVTLEEAAKRMKVSRKSVSRAKKVAKTDPEKHAKAKRGESVRKKKTVKATADDYAFDLAGVLDKVVSPGMTAAFNQANKKDLSPKARKALLASLNRVATMVAKQVAKFTPDAADTSVEA